MFQCQEKRMMHHVSLKYSLKFTAFVPGAHTTAIECRWVSRNILKYSISFMLNRESIDRFQSFHEIKYIWLVAHFSNINVIMNNDHWKNLYANRMNTLIFIHSLKPRHTGAVSFVTSGSLWENHSFHFCSPNSASDISEDLLSTTLFRKLHSGWLSKIMNIFWHRGPRGCNTPFIRNIPPNIQLFELFNQIEWAFETV